MTDYDEMKEIPHTGGEDRIEPFREDIRVEPQPRNQSKATVEIYDLDSEDIDASSSIDREDRKSAHQEERVKPPGGGDTKDEEKN